MKKIVLYGAGGMCRTAIRYISQEYEIVAIIDSDERLHGGGDVWNTDN